LILEDKYNQMPWIMPLPYPQPWYKRIFRDRLWATAKDWYFLLPNGDKVVIYEGFVSDGASVPFLFRIALTPLGGLFLMALVHDFAYRHDKLIGIGKDTDSKEFRYDYYAGAGRTYWDKLFYDLATCGKGVFVTTVKDKALAPACWVMMRSFSWMAWNRYRTLEKVKMLKKIVAATALLLTLTGCGQFNELLWPGFDDEKQNISQPIDRD
jgi:hypothetical protein